MRALRLPPLMLGKMMRPGFAAMALGSLFVESSKVFMPRVDTPENLERFGPVPNLWRTP